MTLGREGQDKMETKYTKYTKYTNDINGSDDTENIKDIKDIKHLMRAELLRTRRQLPQDCCSAAARALTRHALGLPELASAGTVAGYASVGTEPGTRDLLDMLRNHGTRVLLPVLLPDNDLNWAVYEGPGSLAPAGRGLLEPDGARLGADEVLTADVVLLPGLAVDTHGMRLGRGGGSYDRVLERLAKARAQSALVVLVYAHEVVAQLPVEPHDHPVHAVITPEGVRRFAAL